ncbi:MAG: D-alanyl-D-alanine carboxypeptidase, partial [Clostridia bacterium]|nr:D-alanyl-D-alanine carboxypeptidase [Clostridia bacterium]
MLAVILMNTPCFALDLSATSAVILEAETGTILYEKNADRKMGMASTTKIMTALVALEEGKISDIVKVS